MENIDETKEQGELQDSRQVSEPAQIEEGGELQKEEERQTTEMLEFQKKYPEVNIKEMPQSVMLEVNNGVPLKYAYAEYAYSVAQKKLEAIYANNANAAATAGSVSGTGEAIKDFYTKDEFNRLPENRKNQLIDSGQIYEFMANW